jgi:hypothetical protein
MLEKNPKLLDICEEHLRKPKKEKSKENQDSTSLSKEVA